MFQRPEGEWLAVGRLAAQLDITPVIVHSSAVGSGIRLANQANGLSTRRRPAGKSNHSFGFAIGGIIRIVQRSDRDLGRSLRVLRVSTRLGTRNIDLPIAWAGSHGNVVVAFDRYGPTNWHAHLVSADGQLLLAFPWHDHADRILLGFEQRAFPIHADEEVWEAQDEGWWAWVKADGPYVYLAGCDGDEIENVRRARRLEHRGPGLVAVDGVEFKWNRVSRIAYEGAWQDAIDTCRAGQPSPVGTWASEMSDRVHLLA